jgi:2-(1,2-epoxy-1,2-dihydrophenyl)acetyl-CoA isomerase
MIRTSTAGGVTTITLDRPEKLNAFSGTMREDLLAALRDAEGNVVVITGAGRAFCAGGDVEFMASLQETSDVDRFRALLDAGRDVVLQIAAMEKPVIAAVNGVAAGAGCNLALACDYRIASPAAKFSESFVRIGLHPDWGGTWLLPRLVGSSRAFEMMATGRMVDVEEALRIGLVDRVAEDLAAETDKLALSIASAPPALLADLKRALAASRTNGLGAQIDVESEHQLRAFQSAEARQRIMAFLKRS